VDDDPVVRSVLDRSLSDQFEVVGLAADGDEAGELAGASSPDAALVDVQMPGGGGLRAVHGILEAAPDTAIVMLSVDESEMMVRKLMQAGAITYCRKGTSPVLIAESLLDSINACAAQRREFASRRSPAGFPAR
jgi:DNA-binding NarL/FixJ family response regulator